MTITQRTLAQLIRILAARLRERLSADTANRLPVFRNRTLWKLQSAIAEGAAELEDTPAERPVKELADALHRLTPEDLRQSALLREQTVEALAVAETDLKAVAPSPWKEIST